MHSFWELLGNDGSSIAICNEISGCISYAMLQSQVDAFKQYLPAQSQKQLGLILCTNEAPPIAAYLAALQKRDAVMLLDAKLDRGLLQSIVERYRPDWIFGMASQEPFTNYKLEHQNTSYSIWCRETEEWPADIYPELAVLLSTSGTTGSAKFVRLSYGNLQANAESIAAYLRLNGTERAMMTLPMFYSYGLSVINSHLLVGGTILLTDSPVISKPFWTLFNEQAATSFSGVPYIYQMLHRLRFDKMELPSLRYFTQAGGRLAPNLVKYFREAAEHMDARFYAMYGQTEATARISYVPPERLRDKAESVGIAIPGGTLSLDPSSSELIYEGPNVMLGYAESREDLAKGDECAGRLHTGDVASVDPDGYFYLTGRMKRFIKVFGLRLNLDEVENQLEQRFHLPVACLGQDDRLDIWIESSGDTAAVKEYVRSLYKLHASAYVVHMMPELPRMENGKMDYSKLKEMMI